MGLFSHKKDNLIKGLLQENARLRKQNEELIKLCKEKDSFFTEMISDALRHGSSLAGKHMVDKKNYLKGK